MTRYDLIVVGSGLAGLYATLLASQRGARILLLTKERLEDCNTAYAQGGIAAALAASDSPALHYRDTIAAGAGLCDPSAVRILVEEGPARVRELINLGVPFDRTNGGLAFGREGAHSAPRILHAGGDATGANIERTVVARVRCAPGVTIRENHFVNGLVAENGRVTGLTALDETSGIEHQFEAPVVILATGGAGQLFSHTTNPTVATGDGIALAFRVGARITDIEFIQFHPTALAIPGAPRFLISEAVRGEGAVLINEAGERFMARYDERLELAPRDVVARAIASEMRASGSSHVYLDASGLGSERARKRFPTIARVCAEYGIDIGRDPIPVAPAAHYLMGGIRTSTWGETSIPGLFACGECACTGVHGANRLASNSLLETIVFASRVIRYIFEDPREQPADPVADAAEDEVTLPDLSVEVPPPESATAPPRSVDTLRDLAWSLIGLVRQADGLRRLEQITSAWMASAPRPTSRAQYELDNLTLLARLIAVAALLREESRGAHYRSDFPRTRPEWRRHINLYSRLTHGVPYGPPANASCGHG
ncbi:MAG: L-aspartate oxidase [Chloroflexi bacterium]|nr:L-aspartate oxidase [Chloroflexota bacterium]